MKLFMATTTNKICQKVRFWTDQQNSLVDLPMVGFVYSTTGKKPNPRWVQQSENSFMVIDNYARTRSNTEQWNIREISQKEFDDWCLKNLL
jgi:hypothetical protein